MSEAHAQYEYIQLQQVMMMMMVVMVMMMMMVVMVMMMMMMMMMMQEQKINWTRTFTIEQQLRYGITPTGQPLDLAVLKEIQMHQNFQVMMMTIEVITSLTELM